MSKFIKLLIVVVLFSVGSQLFGQMTETDREITKQEQRDKRADYREFMIEKQREYNKVQGKQQIKKMIIENERKRKTRDYARKYSQDKEGLANEIINAYGFELVE